MVDIQKLTADTFTKDTGITVNFTVLPENELRDKVTQDVATQAGQYDVATVGTYEVPIWREERLAARRWATTPPRTPPSTRPTSSSPMVEALSGEDGKLYGDAVLRRVLVPDVPQGRLRGQGPDHARAADLAAGRRHRGQARRRRARHEGHLPARPARLGRGVRPADHGGQHLRRHLVRPRTGRPGQRPGVRRRRPTSTST